MVFLGDAIMCDELEAAYAYLGREDEFKALVGIRENRRLLTLVPIGVSRSWPIRDRESSADVIHWERHQAA